MSSGQPEPHTLAGAYVLDALDAAGRTRFERHLARCEACTAEIGGLRETAARLAAAAAAEPPAGLVERVLATAARTRQLPPRAREARPPVPAPRVAATILAGSPSRAGRTPRRARPPALALAAAAAAAIVAGVLGLTAQSDRYQLSQDQLRGHTIAAVLTAPDATRISTHVTGGGTATIMMSRRERALVFAAAGMHALPASRCYELWLMGPGGDRPAGMLPDSWHGMTGPVEASGLTASDRLGLTVEPLGGSPHPTSAMIMVVGL
jgi:anti-sigma-K factor RskA